MRNDIVYVDLAFIDLGDFAEVNSLYAELFAPGERPARTVYQEYKLPFGGKVKVQLLRRRDNIALSGSRVSFVAAHAGGDHALTTNSVIMPVARCGMW